MLVSVIIPTLNEETVIGHTITCARRNYPEDALEIIVSDGGSSDATLSQIHPSVTVIHSPRGRSTQMNYGAAASHGEILVFCHADSQLPPGWRELILDTLSVPQVSGGTFQTLILPALGLLLRLRNHIQFPAKWHTMFGDQVQFMRRADFWRVGGFQVIPLMEDVEMSRSLHHLGRLVRIPQRVTTSSRRFLERGTLRQTILNGWNIFRYLVLGISAEDIAQSYRSSREKTT